MVKIHNQTMALMAAAYFGAVMGKAVDIFSIGLDNWVNWVMFIILNVLVYGGFRLFFKTHPQE